MYIQQSEPSPNATHRNIYTHTEKRQINVAVVLINIGTQLVSVIHMYSEIFVGAVELDGSLCRDAKIGHVHLVTFSHKPTAA